LPSARSGRLASLHAPLGFDPGKRWEYGINIDIAGRMVEAVSGIDLESYFQRYIFAPLGMTDTSFIQRPQWESRLAAVHVRQADDSLKAIDAPPPPADREFYNGGGGLYSTAQDYMRFLRALMNGGFLDEERILKRDTVTLMGENQMGELDVLPMVSAIPQVSNDVELFPGMRKKWGLSFLINTEDGPNGRAAGSLAWAGINNTYYWLDPKSKIAGVLMTQVLPFADRFVLEALDNFEASVYDSF